MTAAARARAHERLAQRIADARGMHPQVARNVIAHVAEHGTASPWAREVNAHARALLFELYGEAARRALAAVAPAFEQLRNALRAAGRTAGHRESFALAPPADTTPNGGEPE
ncbi:MAG: hypothetical protein ACRDQ0_11740 [Pseudonocardia sp.]